MRGGICLMIGWLGLTLILPLWWLLSKSFQDRDGNFIGLANYVEYFSTPALFASVWNSLFIAVLSTAIVLPLAFVYAYALQRSCMRWKGLFQALALIPILAPSLLPAISLIYLFGNQGFLKEWMFGVEIYGPVGIVISQVFYCFPHALMILLAALSMADSRLYEAADALGASKTRVFFTVTLPGAKYGVISAGFVVFTLVMTDFGIAKVIGGRFNVLATDIFKQVIGQQNFEMGAVVGFVLLIPAVVAFFADRIIQGRQVALLSARAVPLIPKPDSGRDNGLFVFCAVVGGLIFVLLAMAVWASFVSRWPYNLALTLKNYNFGDFDTNGWSAYYNSVEMAAWTAAIGTVIIFVGAYLLEKTRGFAAGRALAQFMAMLPMAVPGLVLGLAYIFFFNARGNPFGFIYATMAILVVNSITHFYTVSHLTASTALKQMDHEFEAVSASLKVSLLRTMTRVSVPVCLPAVLDISIYLFVNAMTTVSAVIFLYSTETKLAAVTIINMDESGFTAAAAAMAVAIVATSASVKIAHLLITRRLNRRTQAWRQR
ncbi:MAG: putative 2-aminoethylphosphonate ABC transporter permease subunit [Rhodoferax sp.]|nr:putative 2-aminoethylphosphonate ABC transporter permease subunit [Rhodoferax sp.]MCP5264375.1 putative 2-aminoethylphosphonate ABC transporter permease subunit [Rhodoferax sp.]MCW5628423.1 putative 2-aminoethylphosphonate ABC transporter permease subunit [Rhodoferax sp.]MCW5644088.1 putative 2-aminoethylphosphonate ABC transporter permease subunit [Rhodoferax sp.]